MSRHTELAAISFVACVALGCSNNDSGGSTQPGDDVDAGDAGHGMDAGDSGHTGDAGHGMDAGDAGHTGDAGPTGDGGPVNATSPLLLVAAGGVGTVQVTLGFSYDVAADAWSAGTPLGDGANGAIDSSNGEVGFAFTGTNGALAVLTDATDATDATGASGPVQFATWASGVWSPFASIGSGVNASGATSLATGTSSPGIAFAGETTAAESSAALASGKWSTVTKLGSLAGGPPSLAARGADATVAYVRSSDGALVAVDRTAGTWGTETVIESGTAAAAATPSFAPSLIALSGTGAALMVVYTDSNESDLHFATRTGTKWSAVEDFGLPTKVVNTDPSRGNAGAGDSPSPSFATPVLALPGGKAILAFTSANQYAYVSQFDGTSWSTATTVFASWGLDTIDRAQVGLAAGVGTAAAEVVFGGSADSSGVYVPYHTRLIAGQWTAPKTISTSGNFAVYALASQ